MKWLIILLLIIQITTVYSQPTEESSVAYKLDSFIQIHVIDVVDNWMQIKVHWDQFFLIPKGDIEGWVRIKR